MSWDQLPIISLLSIIFWISGIFFAFKGKQERTAVILSSIGTAIFLVFIISMWISLGRPPMRTMGETRLWYSLFLSIIGILLYARFKYQWLLAFSILMAVVFIGVNIFKPEIHDRAIMPALQSAWFVPHVIVYMMAYALLVPTEKACRHATRAAPLRQPYPDWMGFPDVRDGHGSIMG